MATNLAIKSEPARAKRPTLADIKREILDALEPHYCKENLNTDRLEHVAAGIVERLPVVTVIALYQYLVDEFNATDSDDDEWPDAAIVAGYYASLRHILTVRNLAPAEAIARAAYVFEIMGVPSSEQIPVPDDWMRFVFTAIMADLRRRQA